MTTHAPPWSISSLAEDGTNGWKHLTGPLANPTRVHLIFTGALTSGDESLGIDFVRINGSDALGINSLDVEFPAAVALRVQVDFQPGRIGDVDGVVLGEVLSRVKEDVMAWGWAGEVKMEMCVTDHEVKGPMGVASEDGVSSGLILRVMEMKGRWVRVVQA
ncbi:hypothetical protein PRZ48_008874 [Zasmidium cellare]|uniref:Uncharacterized protein n=1 Tax=Zasmidium cellare TaxID=395010 RepID=A0ABR0EHQ5_ZASCE|nr:hypothetical protein PRZ48_008874 [Zasmidium cellare]